ncbi:MAG TPA: glycosyltransferase family 39 protein [Polyangiaceae bacterium]|jgi:hypothetical protein|nr:glycosyltransferase family 39 protein [Polyangiaceae bacterium]
MAQKILLVLLPVALLVLVAVSVSNLAITQQLFVDTTYYFLMATVLCWVGTYLHAARELRREAAVAWLRENWPGLLVALAVTVVAALAVQPALRVLSDEANLVGTSKNFFATKSATFTVSGKNYYDSYFDIDVAIDRRPTLFPFLVSLVHAVCGYSYKNVFLFNLLLLPAFVLVSYRLAKSLGGETFGLTAALAVVAHPITLITVRSGAFDFFAAFFALLSLKSLLDYTRDRTPAKLAILWLNLCLFAEIRYESALFIVPVVALLLLFRMVSWGTLRPYAFVYALTPAYFVPRIWQSILRGNIPEQEPGAVVFSLENFLDNAQEYFEPILSPFQSHPAHSAILIALGVVGCLGWLRWTIAHVRAKDFEAPELRFALFVAAWMLLQAIIAFTYVWGRAQYPSAARLVLAIDTFFSFAAAWVVTRALARWQPFVSVLLAVAVFLMHVPVAAQHRMMNRLTQTRESATTWSFFERLNEKRILIVTDQPNLFTIMGYGAMNFETARRDPYLFTAFSRHLFHDVYVIQQIKLSTGELRPGYDLWPDRKLDAVLEFQNDADVLVRISRLAR